MATNLHNSDKASQETQQVLSMAKSGAENKNKRNTGPGKGMLSHNGPGDSSSPIKPFSKIPNGRAKKSRSPLRKTTVKFIEEAKAIHKDRYRYDKTVYKNARSPLKIRCKIHALFLQNPWDHLRGNGCPKCGTERMKEKQRKPLEQFIKEANQVHKHRYGYHHAHYVNYKEPLTIECQIHGPFQQTPNSHLRGAGCHQCGLQRVREGRLKDTDYFIRKAQKTHQDRFDYSESVYVDSNTSVRIICKIHGSFKQNPINHVSGQVCPKCANLSRANSLRKSQEQFIKEANKLHKNRFDYSKVEYHSTHKKVRIICKIHGPFLQTPSMHLRSNGCAHCSGRPFIDTKTFIKRAQKSHGDFYDYSKAEYWSNQKKITIICPRHGLFKTTPDSHWKGVGCQLCRKEKDLEKRKETFVSNARKMHGNRYQYDMPTYVKNNINMTIICPIHGPFETKPSTHLSGHHCMQCHEDLVKRGYYKSERANALSF